ncbi:thioredoxin, mitochondrial-like [Lineus longissimus]|uniref:thioredoxin, mitochondrial-like n=1 Tax=Lineus longissimus TaxID=88925 RepID=UPI002B4DCBA2
MTSRVLFRRLNSLCLAVPTLHKTLLARRILLSKDSLPSSSLVQQVARISTTIPRRDACSFNVQDDEDFKKRVLESDKPVVVDFHASWCGPCKILGPSLEKIISNWKGDVLLAKVDIDEQDLEDTVSSYKIQAVPTVIAVKNGKVLDTFMGVLEDDRVEQFVEQLVGHSPKK